MSVSVIIDVVVDGAVPLPECSRRFSNFFNNDSKAAKPEVKYYKIFSPSDGNHAKMVAIA